MQRSEATLTDRRVSSYWSRRKIKYSLYNTSDKCAKEVWFRYLLDTHWITVLTSEVPWAKHYIKILDALKKNGASATCGIRNKKKICSYVGPGSFYRPLIHRIRCWPQFVTRIPKMSLYQMRSIPRRMTTNFMIRPTVQHPYASRNVPFWEILLLTLRLALLPKIPKK